MELHIVILLHALQNSVNFFASHCKNLRILNQYTVYCISQSLTVVFKRNIFKTNLKLEDTSTTDNPLNQCFPNFFSLAPLGFQVDF